MSTTTTPATASVADIPPVKSDLFKDVKYYVNGTLEPEVSGLFWPYSKTLSMFFTKFNFFSCTDSKIAGQWWCIIDQNYVHKCDAFAVRC